MELLRATPKHGYSRVDAGEFTGEYRGASPCYVDTKGYIPMRTQIERLSQSGERLEEYRRLVYNGLTHGAYDSLDPNFDGEPSPLYDPDFLPSIDMLRAEAILADKRAKQLAQAKERKEGEKLSTSFPDTSQSEPINSSSDGAVSEKTGV